jgi:hypothetical protein
VEFFNPWLSFTFQPTSLHLHEDTTENERTNSQDVGTAYSTATDFAFGD